MKKQWDSHPDKTETDNPTVNRDEYINESRSYNGNSHGNESSEPETEAATEDADLLNDIEKVT